MGHPRRNGGNSFQVSIRPLIKTCPEEAGIGTLTLPDGTRVVALAHAYYPSHDRSIVAQVKRFLADYKPQAIFLLGGMIHEEAFKAVVDDEDVVTQLVGADVPVEIEEIMTKYEGIEDRFLALAKKCGQFIEEFATVSGAQVFYLPSVTGMMPNEVDIMRFVLETKMRLDQWADRHPEEAKHGPDIPTDFAQFLGIANNPQITVMPFGSAVVVNNDTIFKVGDFRRRHPGSASKVDWEQHQMNVVRSFDGKVASAAMTTPVHSLGPAKRNFWHWHEVGNLFDITKSLGYIRTYDRRCKGIWAGTIAGGKIFGQSFPVLPGKDGRRAICVDGKVYEEKTIAVTAKTFKLSLNKGSVKKVAATKTAIVKPKKTFRAKRKPTKT